VDGNAVSVSRPRGRGLEEDQTGGARGQTGRGAESNGFAIGGIFSGRYNFDCGNAVT
jgi:hypothetical protein